MRPKFGSGQDEPYPESFEFQRRGRYPRNECLYRANKISYINYTIYIVSKSMKDFIYFLTLLI